MWINGLSDLFGYFFKQISKNVLVIGSPGLEKHYSKSIAGETELKMITDSAHRYAMVHRGVIKLLKMSLKHYRCIHHVFS
jgi:hypothetical protein